MHPHHPSAEGQPTQPPAPAIPGGPERKVHFLATVLLILGAAEVRAGLTPPPPLVTPDSGTYDMPIEVRMDYGSDDPGQFLRYTLDGDEPTPDSLVFDPKAGDTLAINTSVTLKAASFVAGREGLVYKSRTVTRTYTSSTPKVATPVITPGAGIYDQPHAVTISTSTPGATILYRTDGSAPSFLLPGTEYTGPIDLAPGSYSIVARGYKDGHYKSDAAYSGTIVVQPTTLPTPTLYPGTGTYETSVTVYMGSTVLGATIRYTTDGADPTQTSPEFETPLELTEDTTIKARVYLDGYTPSGIAEASYTIVGPPLPAPTIYPGSGTYPDTVTAYIGSTVLGATIRYSTNGADPNASSPVFGQPLEFSEDTDLRARAFLDGYLPSAVTSVNYVVVPSPEPPTISVDGNGPHYAPLTVTLDAAEAGASIRYTTNGVEPSAASALYAGPFQLGPGLHEVRARTEVQGILGASSHLVLSVEDPMIFSDGFETGSTIAWNPATGSTPQAPDATQTVHLRGGLRVLSLARSTAERLLASRPGTVRPILWLEPGPGGPCTMGLGELPRLRGQEEAILVWECADERRHIELSSVRWPLRFVVRADEEAGGQNGVGAIQVRDADGRLLLSSGAFPAPVRLSVAGAPRAGSRR